MTKKGLFIVFEGVDGCGKTTQIQMLNNYLNQQNIKTHLTKEPGGCPVAQEIRQVILNGDKDKLSALGELMLFSAARLEHLQQTVIPKLKANINILCDRFFYTTYAYQGYAGKLDLNVIDNLTNLATNGLKPDIVILLDIDPKVSLKRALEREQPLLKDLNTSQELRMEEKGLQFQIDARNGFLELAKQNNNFIIINADDSIENIHKNIIKELKLKKVI